MRRLVVQPWHPSTNRLVSMFREYGRHVGDRQWTALDEHAGGGTDRELNACWYCVLPV